jgi:hypothetical protein
MLNFIAMYCCSAIRIFISFFKNGVLGNLRGSEN